MYHLKKPAPQVCLAPQCVLNNYEFIEHRCKTPILLNFIMVVVEMISGPMIEARVD